MPSYLQALATKLGLVSNEPQPPSPPPDMLTPKLAGFKPAPRPAFTPEEQALRDVWNQPPVNHFDWDKDVPVEWFPDSDRSEWMHMPQQPPMFQPDPMMVGGNPGVSRALDQIYRIAPNLKAKSHAIVERIQRPGIEGQTWANGAIELDPSVIENEIGHSSSADTLSHELTHAAGWNDNIAYPAGFLMQAMQSKDQHGLSYWSRKLANALAGKDWHEE